MDLWQYDDRCVRLTTDTGEVFDGICMHNSADYNEHEFGVAEEGLQITCMLFYAGQIRSVEILPENGGPYSPFTDPYGNLELTAAEDGAALTDEILFCEEPVHVLRMLRCLEALYRSCTSFPDRDEDLVLVRKLLSETDDVSVRSAAEQILRTAQDTEEELKALTDKAVAYITDLFRNDAGGHDAEHTLRVWANAIRIARNEPGCSLKTVALGALLHDADDHKLFKTENNANARGFLSANGIPDREADRICEVINSVSFSRNRDRSPETLEGKIVQDADRLDALGAVGIARTFAFGGEHGRPLSDSLQHFRDKLLLLKDLMNTQTAKAEAVHRHEFLVEFMKEYEKETE